MPRKLKLLSRFVRWRWTATGWSYGCLATGWAGITYAAWYWLGRSPAVLVLGASVFLLVFEVGLSYLASAAWNGHGMLEEEGEVLGRGNGRKKVRGRREA